MTTLIITVWSALSWQQQIVVATCGILFLGAVTLFIYGRMRKVLYAIPTLLYQMQRRCVELASNLKVETDAHVKALELMGATTPNRFITDLISNIGIKQDGMQTLDDVKPIIGDIMEPIKTQMKAGLTADPSTIDRLTEYYGKASGLDLLIHTDKQYINLNDKLEKLRTIIPTEEISLSVTEYLRNLKAFSSMIPATMSISKEVADILPLKSSMDLSRWPSSSGSELLNSLSKVREAIDRYYKR